MTGDSLKHSTIDAFLTALGSASATPGGASAAAVVGAIGAGLVEMTARVSANRKDAGEARPELLALADQAATLAGQLTQFADDDVRAYTEVAAAYRLPRSTEADQQARTAAIQRALILATDVPIGTAGCCLGVARLAVRAVEIGSPSIISDAGVGAHVAVAALRGVLLNVDQNLRSIKDEGHVRTGRERYRALTTEADTVLATAQERLRARGAGAP